MGEKKEAKHHCPKCGRGGFYHIGSRGFLKRGEKWKCIYCNEISETDEYGNVVSH